MIILATVKLGMIKRISCFVFSVLFFALVIQLSIPQKAAAASSQTQTSKTTTFTIQGGNANDTLDANGKPILKAHQVRGHNIIRLDASQDGRTAELPVGTRLSLHFPTGGSKISINPDKGIVENAQGKYHLAKGDIALLQVVGQGSATITVITITGRGKVARNVGRTDTRWSGYEKTGSDFSFTDITGTWTVPTATCSSGDNKYSSAWVGIDDGNDSNSDLIQTGTTSACVSANNPNATYGAWYELFANQNETEISNTVHAGDSMFAEVKQVSSGNWTITIKDLTQNWTYSPPNCCSYSGLQSTAEWIVENPNFSGSQGLANYGSASFQNDTLNGANPKHTYATDSIDMVDSSNNIISRTSFTNGLTNAFTVKDGSDLPQSPPPAWNSISSPNPSASSNNVINAVSALSTNNVWSVGTYGNEAHALIEHWDGSSWTQQTPTSEGSVSNVLRGVKSFSGTDVWAVGNKSDSNHSYSLILHYDGNSWTEDTTDEVQDEELRAIDGVGSDAWAVGNYWNGSSHDLTLHLSGGSWSQQSNVSPDTSIDLYGVSEHSSSDVWAVGVSTSGVFTMHYDGSSWSQKSSSSTNFGIPSGYGILYGVTAISANDAWAVGQDYADEGFVTHWNGTTWSPETSLTAGSWSALNAVRAVDSNNIWAAGNYNSGSWNSLIWHSSDGGSSWQQISTENPSSSPVFYGIATDTTTSNAWAVGDYQVSGVQKTLIEQYTPTPYISLRSSSSANNSTGSSSLTINVPAGTANGDVMVAHVVVQTAGNSIAAPSGWNIIKRLDTTNNIATATYWKVAGSSEPSSYTWSFGTSGEASGGIASYTGVDTTNPVDASMVQYNNGTTNVDNTGVTTTYANDMLVYAVGIVSASPSISNPSGFTQEWKTSSSSNTTSEMSQEVASSTGATGTIHGTLSSTYSTVTHLIALKPANATPPTPPSGISLRSSSAGNNGAGSTTLVITKPTGTTTGDVMVAQIAVHTAGNSIAVPSGWNLALRQDTSSSLSTASYVKVATSSEPSSYTWTFGTSGEASGGIGSYIGVDTTTPIDGRHAQYNSGTSNVDNSGVTTTTANDMLVYAAGIIIPTSFTLPSGFTDEWYAATNSQTTSEMSQKLLSSTGATGNIHGTLSTGNYSSVTHLIALRPANAPTPTPPSGISLRSQAANNNGGGSSSLTLNVPNGTQSGDVMVAHVAVRSAGNTITAPSGWTQVVRQDTSSSLSTVAYEKVAGSSEPSNYTWSFGTSGEASGAIGSYIGVNTTNPVDVSHGQYNSATNNVDNSGVTTTAANDMLVYAVGVVQSTTVNPQSGFTEGSYTASNSLTTSEMSQEIDSSSGATGTIHGTENGGGTFSNVTLLIALKAQ